MNAVDLFAGPGGWDFGIRDLGLEPLGIEWDESACATREAAGLRTLRADVSDLDPTDFEPCNLLIGSPPCPTFSAAGDGHGHVVQATIVRCAQAMARGQDTRAEAREQAYAALYPIVLESETSRARDRGKKFPLDLAKVEAKARRNATMSLLVVEPLRWTLDLGPDYIALEQVPGVLPLWRMFGEILRAVGYHVWTGLLSSETFGVPQTRSRAILMASLSGPVEPPRATHQTYEHGIAAREILTLEGTILPWVSMADALGWGMTERVGMTITHAGQDGGSGGRATIERERERSVDSVSTEARA